MRTAQELAALMPASAFSPEEQLAQTRFRCALVESWRIPLGARVLEIGCGQGDTTAVLADAVGEQGRVLAVDLAEEAYGSPVTLGESARALSAGPLGARIQFQFCFDAMDAANGFPDDAFDAVVLAHCTWYFDSADQLATMLRQIRPWARRLCLSEWDLEPKSIQQLGHLLAVLIQGQVEAYKPVSAANVRTPCAREVLLAQLREAGWQVKAVTSVDSSSLADSRWEVAACLANSLQEARERGLPPRQVALVASQIEVLRRIEEVERVCSLNSYSLVAERG